ncbi:uncharacterized protein LOC135703558 [Ochlerotatus camptorhynchus]|uniref:uncharacterized protein LOC135703558 n=1 Tax=Ochlerotatus camptorhynchus TaxID=644619 RepID=UPI0031E41056
MSETRETVVSKRRIVNNANTDPLKTSFDESIGGDYEHAVCDCFGRIDFLLSLYRFICFVFYNLFWGVLWQYHKTFEKMRRFRSCHQMQRKSSMVAYTDSRTHSEAAAEENETSDELCYDDSWIIVNQEEYCNDLSEMEPFKMIHENSWIFIEKQVEGNNIDLNSSGDTVDENIHFVTYLEDEDGDGFQDDDYNDILRQYNVMDPLDRLLEHYEIDWESSMRNHLDDEQASEASHCSEQGMFIEDDYVTSAEAEFFSDITFWNEDVLLDRLCLSKECLSDRDFWNPPLEGILENEAYVLPIYDEDVLAAITGIQRLKPNMIEFVSKSQQRRADQ